VDKALDALDTDSDASEVNVLEERRDEIKLALVPDDATETSEAALEVLISAYRPLLREASNGGAA
jgi:hypothetical protein